MKKKRCLLLLVDISKSFTITVKQENNVAVKINHVASWGGT